MPSYQKSPGSIEQFPIDWSGELADGETIETSNWTTPLGLTFITKQNDTTTTTVAYSGGTAGQVYEAKNTITTSAGNALEQTIFIDVEQV